MHHAGVLHGDFAARNIVVKPGCPPAIIDFSHSQFGHYCRGETLCDELIEAKKLLALGDADLSLDLTLPSTARRKSELEMILDLMLAASSESSLDEI